LHKVELPAFAAISDMDADVDIIVSDDATRHTQASAPVIAVALPALARRYGAALPPGAIDAAPAVMTYPDALGAVPDTHDSAPAVRCGGVTLTHGNLIAQAMRCAGVPAPGTRALLRTTSVPMLLAQVLGVLAAGGSAVIAPGLDDARVPHLAAVERITSCDP
jgi:uncharacterized protein (TIGR03089 family)